MSERVFFGATQLRGDEQILAPVIIPAQPRVLARITEDDDAVYRARCERCAFRDEYHTLSYIGEAARSHAIQSGHAVLVEAL